jgi:tetratricopeptide (TPR) repeat protein
MKKIANSFLTEDIDTKLSLISDSYPNFESFIEGRNKEDDIVNPKIAKARINFANYLHSKITSMKFVENTKKYKKQLLYARTELMKANFLFKSFDVELEELQNLIDEITKQHIVARAEGYWDQGTMNISISQFMEALHYFAIASKYYTRASVICENFMEQRLYLALSKITLASRYEAEANELYKRQDNPKQASEHFQKAVEIVDISLGLLTTINNESLIKSMTAQRSFYEALSFETSGINLFDQEKFKEALEKFEEAMKKLDETQLSATEGSLEQLLEFVRLAKSEVDGYMSMSKTMT